MTSAIEQSEPLKVLVSADEKNTIGENKHQERIDHLKHG